MTCHYLDEHGRFKICKAKGGATPPTIHEQSLYCYKNFYECPVYQAFMQKLRRQQRPEPPPPEKYI